MFNKVNTSKLFSS